MRQYSNRATFSIAYSCSMTTVQIMLIPLTTTTVGRLKKRVCKINYIITYSHNFIFVQELRRKSTGIDKKL